MNAAINYHVKSWFYTLSEFVKSLRSFTAISILRCITLITQSFTALESVIEMPCPKAS